MGRLFSEQIFCIKRSIQMAKKTNSINLYFIGMAIVIIGCFLPLTASSLLGSGASAFSSIVDGSGSMRIGALLAVIGAVAGIIFSFVSFKKNIPVKLISLVVSVVGGIYVWICYMNAGSLVKGAAKLALKATGSKPGIGLFVIAIGWIVAIVGYIKNRE